MNPNISHHQQSSFHSTNPNPSDGNSLEQPKTIIVYSIEGGEKGFTLSWAFHRGNEYIPIHDISVAEPSIAEGSKKLASILRGMEYRRKICAAMVTQSQAFSGIESGTGSGSGHGVDTGIAGSAGPSLGVEMALERQTRETNQLIALGEQLAKNDPISHNRIERYSGRPFLFQEAVMNSLEYLTEKSFGKEYAQTFRIADVSSKLWLGHPFLMLEDKAKMFLDSVSINIPKSIDYTHAEEHSFIGVSNEKLGTMVGKEMTIMCSLWKEPSTTGLFIFDCIFQPRSTKFDRRAVSGAETFWRHITGTAPGSRPTAIDPTTVSRDLSILYPDGGLEQPNPTAPSLHPPESLLDPILAKLAKDGKVMFMSRAQLDARRKEWKDGTETSIDSPWSVKPVYEDRMEFPFVQ